MMRVFGLVNVISLLCITVFCQEKEKRLDSLFSAYASGGMLNGSVLVAEKGKVLFQQSYGLANAEWNIPNNLNTKYLIGSLSKQFVAILILQLAEERKLKLSDRVSNYLSQIGDENADITIHQLLSHTSGLQHFNAIPDFMNVWQLKYSRQDWLNKLLQAKRTVSKEPAYRYSGPGYFILGLIIEKLRGVPLSQAYRKYIFIPAGMKQSLSVEEKQGTVSMVSSPYIMTGAGLLKGRYRDPSTLMGAGDIITTVGDYFLYHQAIKKNILLKEPSLKILLRPYFESEGYSLSFTRFLSPATKDSTTLVFFTGQLSGFTSLAYHVWEEDKFIVTFYNVDNPKLHDIADKALRILYERNISLPKKSITNYLFTNTRKTSLQDAINSYLDLSPSERSSFEQNEDELNSMGYTFIQNEMFAEAVLVFKMNVSLFPKQANAYDSLAEAYYLSGNYKEALTNYEKAFELNASNTNAANMIRTIKNKLGIK